MKFWTPMVEKLTVAASMGITGYNAILVAAPSLPKLPEMLSTPIVAQVSVVTIAAAFTLYGVFMLLTKY